ncbi:hypothetical protein Fmac_032818 [Flemingia macrophylla]|uniref:Uncharacterized protein n=1 Tax=Flemingia macrophylla TaxID=520843 RepID=A0ABD1L617_9FABA
MPLLQESVASVLPMTTIPMSVLLRSNLEWMSILSLLRQTPIANYHSSRDKALDREDGSQLLAQFSARKDAIIIRGVHDVAIDTSAETRKLEGKQDALVNLVTRLAANQKPASVARVCASVLLMTTILVSILLSSNQEWMSILRLMLQTPIIDFHSSRDKALVREEASNSLQFSARNDVIVIKGVHDVGTDSSAEN